MEEYFRGYVHAHHAVYDDEGRRESKPLDSELPRYQLAVMSKSAKDRYYVDSDSDIEPWVAGKSVDITSKAMLL